MRGRRQSSLLPIAILAAVAALAATGAIVTGGHLRWPAWLIASLGALAALALGYGRKLLDVVADRPLTALRLQQDRARFLKGVPGHGRRVDQVSDRLILDVHPAIPLPVHAPADLSDEYPVYVPRDIDADLRTWIRSRVAVGGLVLLVGPAAAGKSRSLYEALRAELGDWKMLRPSGPQINALVAGGTDLSRSVIWLNELQNFFAGEPLSVVAVKALLNKEHGPVILAGSIRAEERNRLMGESATTAAKDMSKEAREILQMPARFAGHVGGSERAVWFEVLARFSEAELGRATALAVSDPRLRQAIRDTRDGDVPATLACAARLIDRWRVSGGDQEGQAVITAAVIARRCGHPAPIPRGVLSAVALAHLSARDIAPDDATWLPAALAWAQAPVVGEIAAIRAMRTTPGLVDGYRVSDILVQHSQERTDPDFTRLLGDETVWRLVLLEARSSAVAEIALSAYLADKLDVARDAWRIAADCGDARAMRRLGLLYWELGQDAEAETWLRKAAEDGTSAAVASLAHWLEEHRQAEEAEWLLTRAAQEGEVYAMVELGLAFRWKDQPSVAEQWTRKAAELGSAVAMSNLGFQLARRGAIEEAESWLLKAAEHGVPGAMENLAELYLERGDLEMALEWYKRGAESGYAQALAYPQRFRPWPGEGGDQGVSEAMLRLAEFITKHGQRAEARTWYVRGAELGDSRAAAALAFLVEEDGEPTEAARWRKQAAELARANLTLNKATLRAAYGETAVLCHTAIMTAHADALAQQGKNGEAEFWYRCAAEHGDSAAAHRLDQLLREPGT
jgi:hypothetical protein